MHHHYHTTKPKRTDDDYICKSQNTRLFLYMHILLYFSVQKNTFFSCPLLFLMKKRIISESRVIFIQMQIFCFIGILKCARFHCSLPKLPNKGFIFNKQKPIFFSFTSWSEMQINRLCNLPN